MPRPEGAKRRRRPFGGRARRCRRSLASLRQGLRRRSRELSRRLAELVASLQGLRYYWQSKRCPDVSVRAPFDPRPARKAQRREKRRDQARCPARPAPLAAARAGRERHRDGTALRRHSQLLQRGGARAHAPARHRRGRQGRRAPGRRHAVRVRGHGHLRRPRHEPSRHAVLAAEPRADRRYGRVDGGGARVRRPRARALVRQGRPRHAHGRCAPRPAGRGGGRRADARRARGRRQRDRLEHGLRGRRPAHGRQDRRRGAQGHRVRRLSDVRVLFGAVHGQLDGLSHRGAGPRSAGQRHHPGAVLRAACGSPSGQARR